MSTDFSSFLFVEHLRYSWVFLHHWEVQLILSRTCTFAPANSPELPKILHLISSTSSFISSLSWQTVNFFISISYFFSLAYYIKVYQILHLVAYLFHSLGLSSTGKNSTLHECYSQFDLRSVLIHKLFPLCDTIKSLHQTVNQEK